MTASAEKQLEIVLGNRIGEVLASAEFVQEGLTYRRRRENGIDVVGAQTSDSDACKFTINVGLYVPSVESLVGRHGAVTETPDAPLCTLSTRLGVLTPASADVWWRVGPRVDLQALNAELAMALSLYALPWFAAHSAIQDLVASNIGLDPLRQAAVCCLTDNTAGAIELMKACIFSRPHTAGAWLSFARRANLERQFQAIRTASRGKSD